MSDAKERAAHEWRTKVQRDAERTAKHVDQTQKALLAKTAKLRALRLAKEAEELKTAEASAAAKAAKKALASKAV